MKVKDIRELTDAEIVARIKDEEEMLVKMGFNHSISEIENPAKLRHARKTIARLRTVIREREMEKNQIATEA